MHKKIFLGIFLSFCIALLSSCTDGNGENITASESEDVISGSADLAESEAAVTELPIITESTESTEIPPEITETESDADISDTAGSSAEAGKTEIPEITAKTETKTEAPQTAAAVTTQKPPAEVVIPKINMPQSPGTSVISGTNAEVDHSNASEGYISAVYTGSSKAAKIRIKCGSTQYDHDLSVGGKREYFPLMGSGSYSVSVYEQASGSKYALLASGDFDVTIKSATGMYLYPNKYIDFSSSSGCVKKAAEVCAGITDDVEKIAAIFTYTTDNISYDKQLAATVQSGYVPNPDSTLSSKKGICFDYASLFAAMCRSQGIPTRLVIGYAEPDIYHAWNEVYTDETGWITPELFLKKKGYNIADTTFYASNSNKDKIAKYISDDGNYSAVYRY